MKCAKQPLDKEGAEFTIVVQLSIQGIVMRRPPRKVLVLLALYSIGFLVAGCKRTPRSLAELEAAEPTGPYAAGRKVFLLKGCARCHTVDGGDGMERGPDLSKIAADPLHTPSWLAEHVRRPQAHNPQSRMPAFDGRITDDEMRSLTEYLSSLR